MNEMPDYFSGAPLAKRTEKRTAAGSLPPLKLLYKSFCDNCTHFFLFLLQLDHQPAQPVAFLAFEDGLRELRQFFL